MERVIRDLIVTIKPETAKQVTLSVHALAGVRKDLDDMRGASDNNINKKHKEEMASRIASDRADRNNLRESCKHVSTLLLQWIVAQKTLSISTQDTFQKTCYVDKSVTIGNQLMEKFISSCPEGFRGTISRKVITMATSKWSDSL